MIGTAGTTGEVNVHLNGVNIQTAAGHALQIMDDARFDVKLEIPEGTESTLDASQGTDTSGIKKDNVNSLSNPGTLTIYGTGTLIAKGGNNACGIGNAGEASYHWLSNLIIQNVTIEAEGKGSGGGIGSGGIGGYLNGCTIENATITAQGTFGIGTYQEGYTVNLSIKNSAIDAWGKENSAIGGVGLSQCTIEDSVIKAYASNSPFASAGIGGFIAYSSACKETHILNSIIYTYGGRNSSGENAAGIGVTEGYEDSCSNNSISGNSLVYAASGGSSCPALMGFDTSGLTGGMVFEGVVTNYTDDPFENPYTVSWNKGTIYGETTLSKDMSESLDLPVTTTIDKNATFKVANDSKLTIPNTMSLQNDGKLDSLKNITIANGGSITTANNFYLKDATTPSTSNYATYLTSTGVVQNYTNVPALPQNYIHGWFSNSDGTGTQIYNGKPVELNLHNFYEVESEAYLINAPSVENGTITLNKDYAFQGDKVSFTLTPDEGYRVGEVTVTTEDGKTIQLEEAGNTYSFTMPASEVTIHVIFSEGAGEDSPVVIESPEHGTIKADKDKAKEGDSVSFTVSPDEGYELKEGSLTITDSEGNVIDYTVKDGIYSFIMPSTGVSISAVFEPIAAPKEGWEQDDTGWRYFVDNAAISGWRWIDDTYGAHWYFFGDDTYMVTSTFLKDNGYTYWVCSTGPMITKLWQWIDSEWYGFYWDGKMCTGWVWDTDWNAWFYCYQNGIMARNTWIDAYWLDWRGVWLH